MAQPQIKRLERALIESCWVHTAGRTRSETPPGPEQAERFALVGAMDRCASETLAELGLENEAVVALVFVPMLEVLWRSSGSPESKREALHRVATELGLNDDDVGYIMLRSCACQGPRAGRIEQWQALVHALVPALERERLSALQSELMDRAWRMASELHGESGMHWPSPVFSALTEIEQTFYEV